MKTTQGHISYDFSPLLQMLENLPSLVTLNITGIAGVDLTLLCTIAEKSKTLKEIIISSTVCVENPALPNQFFEKAGNRISLIYPW